MTFPMSNDDFNPNSVDATLSRIETKLDAALERVDALEKVVRDLDKFKYWMLGIAAAAGVVGGKITALFKQ